MVGSVRKFHCSARGLEAVVKSIARKKHMYSTLEGQHSDNSTTRTRLLVWTSLGSPSQLNK